MVEVLFCLSTRYARPFGLRGARQGIFAKQNPPSAGDPTGNRTLIARMRT